MGAVCFDEGMPAAIRSGRIQVPYALRLLNITYFKFLEFRACASVLIFSFLCLDL